MYYYLKQTNDDNTAIVSSSKLPKNMDGVTLISKEEYISQHKLLQEKESAQNEEESTEQAILELVEKGYTVYK